MRPSEGLPHSFSNTLTISWLFRLRACLPYHTEMANQVVTESAASPFRCSHDISKTIFATIADVNANFITKDCYGQASAIISDLIWHIMAIVPESQHISRPRWCDLVGWWWSGCYWLTGGSQGVFILIVFVNTSSSIIQTRFSLNYGHGCKVWGHTCV